jgi:membrane protein implicated in regulation of membrane protease activity
MTPTTIWIALAAFLAVMEMMTGTFYLLVAAFGFAAAALVAAFYGSMAVQIVAAAVVSLIGWAIVYKFTQSYAHADARSNPDVNPDIGATVRISAINTDGSLTVHYRGTNWLAVVEHGAPDQEKDYKVIRVEGSKLILEQSS